MVLFKWVSTCKDIEGEWKRTSIGVMFVTCHFEMHLARMRHTRAPLYTPDIMMTERPYMENIDDIDARDQIRLKHVIYLCGQLLV